MHALRPLRGQQDSAANVLVLLEGSAINESHRWCDKVQDAYSLRCAPQVHGATRDLLDYVDYTVSVELNAATDNPLVLVEDDLLVSNGNFHGQPLAFALDALAIGVAELANISERRVERLVNPSLSGGLPPFLTVDGGLNSGFMIPQYVAASLVSENKVLAHPASVDSIPTSAGQEDHVSMGNAAGLKAWQVLGNVEWALAIELLAGAQGVEFLAPLEPGPRVAAAHAFVRALSPRADRGPAARRRDRGRRRRDSRRVAGRRRRGCRRGAAVTDRPEAETEAALGRDAAHRPAAPVPRQRDRLRGARRNRRRRDRTDRWQHARGPDRRPAAVRGRNGVQLVALAAARTRGGRGPMTPTVTIDAAVETLCGDLSRIRAPRGTELNARSWSTEAPLRMLLNNLDREVAEQPEALVVYGGTGRAARSHDALKGDRAHPAPARRRTRPSSSRAARRSASSAPMPLRRVS